MTTVVDASAMVEFLVGGDASGARSYLRADLAAPDLFYVEVASGLIRAERSGVIARGEVEVLLDELLEAPIDVVPTRSLIRRAVALRDRVSVYDACYVALAEELGCAVLTADRRLARAPGLTVPVTVV